MDNRIQKTLMTDYTRDYIRDKQQCDKYEALNTYKIKLATTQAANYSVAVAGQVATAGLSKITGEQNTLKPYWFLPAIEGNHIENCLMRIKSLSMSVATYTFYSINKHATHSNVDYSENNSGNNLLYIMCDSVIQKTFASNSEKHVIRKNILGSYNYSHLVKDKQDGDYKEMVKTYSAKTDHTSMMDDGWVLAKNPFGSKIGLHLEHFDHSVPIIKSSTDGLPGDNVFNLDAGADSSTEKNRVLDIPIIYELEIKLLPDNQSNDKLSY